MSSEVASPSSIGRSSTCLRCSCAEAQTVAGERIFLSTAVSHTFATMGSFLTGRLDVRVAQLGPGLLEVTTPVPIALLMALRAALTGVEADEVRALVTDSRDHEALLAAAFMAISLAQASSRAEYANLLPLFDNEARAFHSVYQPIVSLRASRGDPVVAYEALLRATGPAGPIMPDELFPAASRAGWLHVLDRVGRTSALRGASGWIGDRQLFINFVPTSIYRPEVCLQTTEQAAEQAGLRLDQLVFEVTESEKVTDVDHLSKVFDYYRQRGCKVALDDLGSGYASLNMLVRLRPDIVKLDKAIVQGLPDPVALEIIAAIVRMTHSYGGLVLAECVETVEQADIAIELGVDLGQGWHFGKPLPPEGFKGLTHASALEATGY